jgi:hypothetical protein
VNSVSSVVKFFIGGFKMLKRIPVIGMTVLALLFMAGACAKKYDAAKVRTAMQELSAALKAASKYGNPLSTDFAKAKDALEKVKKAYSNLGGLKAPKGDQNEWDAIHKEGMAAAERGIKACDAKDKKVLTESIIELTTGMVKGHLKFRM